MDFIAPADQVFPADEVPVQFRLALTLEREGHFAEAQTIYRRILAGDLKHLGAWNNLALLLDRDKQVEAAEQCCREGLRYCPEADAIYNTLGEIKLHRGNAAQALAAFRRAVELRPESQASASNVLLTLNYLGGPPEELLAEHQHWVQRCHVHSHIPELASIEAEPRLPSRRLRVGYLSADFRRHSVAFFIEPLLHFHDRAQFEIHLFSDVGNPDGVTDRLYGMADTVHQLAGLSNADAAAVVRAARVDVLVDLAGHTGNRMELFVRRCAPVQVTWLGYPNTSGAGAMDWRLTDEFADPPAYDRYYTERQWRLPGGMWAYAPPDGVPDPVPPPLLRNGYVTFGSFNHIAKLSDAAIRLWAAAMQAVPGSRLIVKNSFLVDPGIAAELRRRLGERGIAPERIDTRPFNPSLEQHLQEYNDIDIALDSWPYNGTTTTFEALWMGVPVLTMTGENHASRTGSAILRRCGLDLLVAADSDAFVRKAAALAEPGLLTALRSQVRNALASSSLCDGRRLALEIEDCYRNICRW